LQSTYRYITITLIQTKRFRNTL